MSAGGDGGDVVCAGAHGVWGFEGFVDGEVAPCAGEVVSFEDFCPFAPVLCVTGSAHVVAPPFDFGHKKTPIRISGPVGVLMKLIGRRHACVVASIIPKGVTVG